MVGNLEITVWYICKEENKIVSILNYIPTVPASVTVIPISDDEYSDLQNKTHYFDVVTNQICKHTDAELQKQKNKLDVEKLNGDMKLFLANTDWKILRHLREKALGVPTSMSEPEYLLLETQRHDAARSIQKV